MARKIYIHEIIFSAWLCEMRRSRYIHGQVDIDAVSTLCMEEIVYLSFCDDNLTLCSLRVDDWYTGWMAATPPTIFASG